MSSISARTQVYPFFWSNVLGKRIWITSVENKKNQATGSLVLWPAMDDDFRAARSFEYEIYLIMRRRFAAELPAQYGDLRIVLTPGDVSEELDSGVSGHSSPDLNNRTVEFIGGLVVRPGYDVSHGACWFVKIYGEGGIQIDSVRGDSAESTVATVFDRGLQAKAEKAPPPPKPVQEETFQPAGPTIRPGDRWR